MSVSSPLHQLASIPWPPAHTIEPAPGKVCKMPPAPDPLPRYMLVEVIPLGGGTFRMQPRPLTEWLGLSQVSLEKLGITLSENTLRRLGRAGFIRVRPVSPNRYEFNYQSWLEHCAQVEADPEEFWDRRYPKTGPSNREKYLAAL